MTPAQSLVLFLAVASVAVSVAGLAWRQTPNEPAAVANAAADRSELSRLQAHLARQPDDFDAWMALGRLHQAARKPKLAAAAYAGAARIRPADPAVNRALLSLAAGLAKTR